MLGESELPVTGTHRCFASEYRRDLVCLVLDWGSSIASVAWDLGLGDSVVGRWAKLERHRRQTSEQRRLVHASRSRDHCVVPVGVRSGEGERVFGKSRYILRVAARKCQRFELMDAQKASH